MAQISHCTLDTRGHSLKRRDNRLRPLINRILPCIVPLGLAACNPSGGGVKGATGDTPVKFVICRVAESNCFVAARFKEFDDCQSHKTWGDMLCDTRSKPNEMICRTTRPTIAFSNCTH